jgi:Fe-S cluster biosynthesis and repair protein YggX
VNEREISPWFREIPNAEQTTQDIPPDPKRKGIKIFSELSKEKPKE